MASTNLLKSLIIFCVVLFVSQKLSSQTYFYSFNDTIHLDEYQNKYVVKFQDTCNPIFINAVIGTANPSDTIRLVDTYAVFTTTQIQNLNSIGIESINKFYTSNGIDLLFSNKIFVLFNNSIQGNQVNQVENQFGLVRIDSTPACIVYEVHPDSNVISIANNIQELGITIFSYPSFYSLPELYGYIPNDEHFNYQFNLHSSGTTLYNDDHWGTSTADINMPEAWELTFGSYKVITAVIDDGVAEFHDDLPNQVRLPGSNFALRQSGNYGTDPNNPVSDGSHGTAVAGLIGAQIDNEIGIAGIAPKSRVMPLRVKTSTLQLGDPAKSLANAIIFATNEDCDIINISLGWSDANSNLHPVVVQAINYSLQYGRNGKGCVIVAAASNTANHTSSNIGIVGFPANVDLNQVITVGASNRMATQANYSPTNEKIDVVAPSHHAFCGQINSESLEIWSLDEPGNYYGGGPTQYNPWGNLGYCSHFPPQPGTFPNFSNGDIWPDFGTNHLDYTGRFGGTSAAAPQVSGLAALILSINPCLTAQEVKDYITENTDQIGSYNYNWNSSMAGHSKEVGYGKINAYETLLAVREDLGSVQTGPITTSLAIFNPTDYASDIEIASGGSLTVFSTLRMARDRKIVVQPGGKLILNAGSRVTSISDCEIVTWQGIQVGGNSTLSQNETNQGSVIINGTAQNPAIIENAVDAISTSLRVGNGPYPPINWQSFGGIIKADYCNFQNNLRDVEFMKFSHSENGILQPNVSYFNHCNFVKNSEFVAPNTRGAFVSMWDVQGVTFTACAFEYVGVPLEDQAVKHGIRAEYTKGFNGPITRVYGTEFKSANGLYIGGSHFNQVTRNSFYVAKSPSPMYYDIPYGVYFDYAMNFTAQENEFYTQGTTGYNAGMVVNNHGPLNQLIYNNTFDRFMLGLNAQGENRSSNNGLTGLECRCNNFSNGTYDMFVVGDPNQPWNGIQRDQGANVQNRPELLAGNLFSLTGGIYSDYFNLPDYINYHHHDPNYGSNPANVAPVDVYKVINHKYPVTYQSCDALIGSGKTSGEWQIELADAEQSMLADEDLLFALLNEENNWQLEAEILFATQYDNWYDVYIDLMNQSPYLDHGIIEGLIENTDFPDLMLRNIMLANPDAAKDEYLLSLIYNRNMPTWMVEDIEEGQSSYGAKEVLVDRIGRNIGMQHNAIAQLLGIYGNSTSYNGLDSAIALLSSREELPLQYLLADAYLAKGQYTQAINLVNNLPQNHTFSEKEGLDYPNYLLWYTLRADLAEENQTWFDVDAAQKLTLQGLADTINKNQTMLWANHVLKLIGEESSYSEPVYLPNLESSKTAGTKISSNTPQELVKVYPNPASDVLNVVANGVVKGQVALFDLSGKLLMQTKLDFGTAILNVKGLSPGVYLARIYAENNEEVQTVKVVVAGE